MGPLGDLSDSDKNALLDIILSGEMKLSELEKKFKDTFDVKKYENIAKALQTIVRDLISSCDGVGLISSIFLVSVLREAKLATSEYLLFDVLIEIERGIRKDLLLAEQLKYATKESKDKKQGPEAAITDAYRTHNAAKLFIFNIIAKNENIRKEEAPEYFLKKSQEDLDAELTTWEGNVDSLKEAMSELSNQWCTYREKCACGGLLEHTAVVEIDGNKKSLVTANMPTCSLPTTPLSSGELSLLFPMATPHITGVIPMSEEWKLAKKMLDDAQEKKINEDDYAKVENVLNENVIKCIGIDNSVLLKLATYNPDICGILLPKCPGARVSAVIQLFFKKDVPMKHIEQIMSRTRPLLEQINVRTYVNHNIIVFKDKQLSTADKDRIKDSCLFLFKLITENKDENKEIYIAEAVKSDMEGVFKACGDSEVIEKWEVLKK